MAGTTSGHITTKEQGVDILLQERPYASAIIQTQLLMDIAGILYEQLAVTKDAIVDYMKKYRLEVTDQVMEINADKIPTMPWNSVSIYNDGANPIHIYINEVAGELVTNNLLQLVVDDPPIKVGETYTFDMRAPKIQKVYLICDPGNSATVRIYAGCKNYRPFPRDEANI